jgi:tetratricopeptide repeat protein 30
LQAAIRYQLNDVNGCRALVELGRADDLDTLINQGCLLFKVDYTNFKGNLH